MKKQTRLDVRQTQKQNRILARRIKSLQMVNLDIDIVDAIVTKLMEPVTKKADMSKYGTDKKLNYHRCLFTIETIHNICRNNGWTTREDWVNHDVHMNKLFTDLFRSAEEYSKVKMFYDQLKYNIIPRTKVRGF